MTKYGLMVAAMAALALLPWATPFVELVLGEDRDITGALVLLEWLTFLLPIAIVIGSSAGLILGLIPRLLMPLAIVGFGAWGLRIWIAMDWRVIFPFDLPGFLGG